MTYRSTFGIAHLSFIAEEARTRWDVANVYRSSGVNQEDARTGEYLGIPRFPCFCHCIFLSSLRFPYISTGKKKDAVTSIKFIPNDLWHFNVFPSFNLKNVSTFLVLSVGSTICQGEDYWVLVVMRNWMIRSWLHTFNSSSVFGTSISLTVPFDM